MINELHVNYIKLSNLDSNGIETEIVYALHIFNGWSEITINRTPSFDELKKNVSLNNLFTILNQLSNIEYLESFEDAGGLFFNMKWLTFEQVKNAEFLFQNSNIDKEEY